MSSVIINREDAHNFMESIPSAERIDSLSRHELMILAEYLNISVSTSDSAKSQLLKLVKNDVFGIHYSRDLGNQEEGAVGGEVEESDHGNHVNAVSGETTTVPRLSPPPGVPLGFTVSESLEYLRIQQQHQQLEHEYRMAQLQTQNASSLSTLIISPFWGLVTDFYSTFF